MNDFTSIHLYVLLLTYILKKCGKLFTNVLPSADSKDKDTSISSEVYKLSA
jgi:hypothetical protein